jgi:hypothetical protein
VKGFCRPVNKTRTAVSSLQLCIEFIPAADGFVPAPFLSGAPSLRIRALRDQCSRLKGFDFMADNPGPTLFHCQQQLHMDFGFMALFNYA